MDVKKHVLKSGLRLVISPMSGTEAATVIIFVRAGSRCETPEENGISHFEEHMFFKGAMKYPDTQAVAETVAGMGARQNAFTSEEMVAYFIQCASSKLEIAFDVLSDMLIHSKFDPEEIKRESGVIIQERNRHFDKPDQHIGGEWMSLIFGDQPLGRLIVGPAENITRFGRDDFITYKNRLYVPDNMVVSVAGKVTNNEVLGLTERYFPLETKPMPAGIWPAFRPELARQNAVSLVQKDTKQAHFILGVLAPPDRHPTTNATRLLSAILGAGMSSRLFLKVRERQGLAYQVGNSYERLTDAGFFAAEAGVKLEAVDQAVRTILDEYRDVYENGVKPEELEKVKNMIEGQFALSLESSQMVADYCGEQEVLHGDIRTPEEVLREMRTVTLADVHEAARNILAPSNLAMAVIGPFDNPAKFESLLTYGK